MFGRVFVCLLPAVALWTVTPAAGAQPETSAIVLPVTVGHDTDWVSATATKVGRELAQRGIETLSPTRATEAFEERVSASAPSVSESDIEEWVERSRSAVRHLARGDYASARKDLIETQRLSNKASEELNREASRARQVLDTCLYMVRALHETNRNAEARKRARECRMLVPRLEPTPHRHTPEVQSILERVDRSLAKVKQGSLSVTSIPSGCELRLNGVSFGRTPFVLEDLTPGQYSLQVECDTEARGRVHRIEIKPGPNAISVDTSFDRAIRTVPTLSLNYPDSSVAKRANEDARQVARAVNASGIYLLSTPSKDVLRIDTTTGSSPTSVWLRTSRQGPSRSALSEALDALIGGQSMDFTGGTAVSRKPTSMDPSPRKRRRASTTNLGKPPKTQRVIGYSLLGAGAAGIVTGIALHVVRGGRGDDMISAVENRPAGAVPELGVETKWLNAGIGSLVAGVAGAAVTTAAVPFILPYRDKTPWWGWVSGGVGLALVAVSLQQGLSGPDRPSACVTNTQTARDCVRHGEHRDRAALLGSAAAPLVTIPLVYLLRPKRATPSLTATRQGFELSLQGSF